MNKWMIWGETPLFLETPKRTKNSPPLPTGRFMFTRGAIHHSLGLDQFGGEGMGRLGWCV